ncbi:hypothetical protein KDA23_05555 [Candidatus Saccharibacteria bacterium]|nr:hypothetical protein [Candidatus Saccharibacteria bacterium]
MVEHYKLLRLLQSSVSSGVVHHLIFLADVSNSISSSSVDLLHKISLLSVVDTLYLAQESSLLAKILLPVENGLSITGTHNLLL